jgi:para-aminobenzoate synthetase/4-amino-4-deoxychorismate lyase
MDETSTGDKTGQAVIRHASTGDWLCFRKPVQIISAHHPDEVIPGLEQVESLARSRDLFAAGLISYEAAPAFDESLTVRPDPSFPLLWFGLYPPPEVISPPITSPGPSLEKLKWAPSINREEYGRAIRKIKTRISRGETYQVNFTFRLGSPFPGNPWRLFQELAGAQPTDYAAYVDMGEFAVCSASPELFFRLEGRKLTSRPMKGTAPRGRFPAEDEAKARWLHNSEKNRAENLMIVDMVRNDMGRVAETGSVEVTGLFDVERYPTVWQMTSTVSALTDASLVQIFTALFPCASITGAPKPRTMEIIADLETTPRRAYTGCMGYLTPDRRAQFNVAIRTVVVDRSAGRAEYGTGGGILWGSGEEEEYQECLFKARVLSDKRPDFSLLESILWTPEEGCFLLEYHLDRLTTSAAYFNYPVDEKTIQARLHDETVSLPPGPHKVRLLLNREGTVSLEVESLPFQDAPQPVRLGVSPSPVDPEDVFLYHKTTHRRVYEEAATSCPDCDDVLLWNPRGEVTEATSSNVVIRHDGRDITPPLECGLLPGTFRAKLLEEGSVEEGVITFEMLERSEKIFLVNSVRRWREAVLTAWRGEPSAERGDRGTS